ncbi:MAG: 50S ribosomal protein L10 [Caldisericales bacterium]|nr:50S ribosomal protein L10 [Caldisericales bacterium]
MITKQKKSELLEELREQWKNSAGLIFSDTQLLPSTAVAELRREVRKADLFHKVYKNTLIEKVAKEMGVTGLEKYLVGPTAITFAKEEAPVAAKVIADLAKKFPKKLALKAAISEGQVYDSAGANVLANIPSRQQLLGMIAYVLIAPVGSFARAVNAVKEQKEKAA